MNNLYIKITKLIIWVLGVCGIAGVFLMPAQPILAEGTIDDRYVECTPQLYPGDTFSQTFLFGCDALESVSIAFSYDIVPDEKSQLFIQIYQDDTLLVEQPLPLSACPNGKFLNLNPGSRDFSDSALTICVTNISENTETSFALLATTDSARYRDYTNHYQINGESMDGSIFCRFRYLTYRTDYDFYRKLTAMFLVLLVMIILTAAIDRLDIWKQQHIPRSRV